MRRATISTILLFGALACDKTPTAPDFRKVAPSGVSKTEETGQLSVSVSGESVISEPGDYTYTASVSGGSGSYVYHWYQRGCNLNNNEVWCMQDHFLWTEGEGVNSMTIWRGAYDVKIDITVEVQESSGDNPPSGVGTKTTGGPNEAFWNPPIVHGSMNPCDVDFVHMPLMRYVFNVDTELYYWQEYGRNPCTGAIFTPGQ